MKSLWQDLQATEDLIRQLQKIESKMRSGQFIDGHRDVNRIISNLNKYKQSLVNEEIKKESDE